jgi:hypothetical protein
MRAARLLVLLTLAAVFSMHGLQCMSADPTGTHPAEHSSMTSTDSMAVMVSAVAMAPAVAEAPGVAEALAVAEAPAVAMAVDPAVQGHAIATMATGTPHGTPTVAAAGLADPVSPGSGHGWAHALAVCLAVLLAGLAVLAAALLLRRAAPIGSREALLARARSWWAAIQLPRPPDLAVLCLLRI